MPTSADENRLKTFHTQLWVELYKIPTPAETAAFLVGNSDARTRIARTCKQRAQPILAMIREVESWGIN